MNISLSFYGEKFAVNVPFDGCDYAGVKGQKCFHCGVDDFRIQGKNMRISGDDRAYEADAYCVSCNRHVGTIRAEMKTLFGVREDEAVLNGRCRVY